MIADNLNFKILCTTMSKFNKGNDSCNCKNTDLEIPAENNAAWLSDLFYRLREMTTILQAFSCSVQFLHNLLQSRAVVLVEAG